MTGITTDRRDSNMDRYYFLRDIEAVDSQDRDGRGTKIRKRFDAGLGAREKDDGVKAASLGVVPAAAAPI